MRQKHVGDYELIERTRDGNYGSYWRARPPARLEMGGEDVEIKIVEARIPGSHIRIANELRLHHATQCKELVPILDAGLQGERLFYASPIAPLGSLAFNNADLDKQARIEAIAAAARAADCLHEVGVAHRDIRPDNIQLFPDGAKLGDLGLAQILEPLGVKTGDGPIGSVAYQAPEVTLGQPGSRASDVFSLGVSLHETLSGESPFPKLKGQTLNGAITSMVQPTIEINQALTEAEIAVISRCLKIEPSERYETARILANELKSLASEDQR